MIAADATTTGRPIHKKRFMTHAQQGAWTRAILMGIYVAITAFPFYWMVITALKTNNDLYTLSNNPLWFNELPTLGHIDYLFRNTRFGTWMLNSAIIGVCQSSLPVRISSAASEPRKTQQE